MDMSKRLVSKTSDGVPRSPVWNDYLPVLSATERKEIEVSLKEGHEVSLPVSAQAMMIFRNMRSDLKWPARISAFGGACGFSSGLINSAHMPAYEAFPISFIGMFIVSMIAYFVLWMLGPDMPMSSKVSMDSDVQTELIRATDAVSIIKELDAWKDVSEYPMVERFDIDATLKDIQTAAVLANSSLESDEGVKDQNPALVELRKQVMGLSMLVDQLSAMQEKHQQDAEEAEKAEADRKAKEAEEQAKIEAENVLNQMRTTTGAASIESALKTNAEALKTEGIEIKEPVTSSEVKQQESPFAGVDVETIGVFNTMDDARQYTDRTGKSAFFTRLKDGRVAVQVFAGTGNASLPVSDKRGHGVVMSTGGQVDLRKEENEDNPLKKGQEHVRDLFGDLLPSVCVSDGVDSLNMFLDYNGGFFELAEFLECVRYDADLVRAHTLALMNTPQTRINELMRMDSSYLGGIERDNSVLNSVLSLYDGNEGRFHWDINPYVNTGEDLAEQAQWLRCLVGDMLDDFGKIEFKGNNREILSEFIMMRLRTLSFVADYAFRMFG